MDIDELSKRILRLYKKDGFRMSLNELIIKRLNTLQDLFRMMREYSLGVSKDVLVDLYQHSIQDNKQDFLLVYLDSEPRDRFRFNFLDVYDLNGI